MVEVSTFLGQLTGPGPVLAHRSQICKQIGFTSGSTVLIHIHAKIL